jgi:hypothetical protein
MLLPSEINAPALLNDCNRHAGAMLFFLNGENVGTKKVYNYQEKCDFSLLFARFFVPL